MALLLLAGLLMTAAAACVKRGTYRSSPLIHETTHAVETSAIASPSEVRALMLKFRQPEEPGDLGYELLGANHNDTASWVRAVVLGNTDYGRLVHSLVSQQSGIPTDAIAIFDQRLASKGATSTYDMVVNSEWTTDNGVNSAGRHLTELIPASTFMGDLFDGVGHLAGSRSAKSLEVAGSLASMTFTEPGRPNVTLEFEIARDSDGRLHVVGLRNYSQLKRALAGTDLVEGLP
ncbi:MAG: hypothetical protein P4L93_10550 [Coriobacteriia bacterium]|nr:hypothetical protein [Coriobacteriia bacterium]